MEQNSDKKHLGKIIEKAIRDSGLPVKYLAKRLGMARNTLYNKFNKPQLDASFIAAVGKITHYDFFHDSPDLREALKEEKEKGQLKYTKQDRLNILKLTKKCDELLESCNALLNMLLKFANERKFETLQKDLSRLL